jgi:hypothetical protein
VLTYDTHRFAFDLFLVYAGVGGAPLHAMNRLEPEGDCRKILERSRSRASRSLSISTVVVAMHPRLPAAGL